MSEREQTTEQVASDASDREPRVKAAPKPNDKRIGFDVLVDEEPQICRGVD